MRWSYKLLAFFVLFIVEVGASGENKCNETRCAENGPRIRSPFRLKGSDDRCGFPGFELSCNGAQTVIEFPKSVKFVVRKINYKSREIDVYDLNNCLVSQLLKIHGFSNSPFYYVNRKTENYSFFNCSTSEDYFSKTFCLHGPGYHIGVLLSTESIDNLPLNCTWMYNTPIPSTDWDLRYNENNNLRLSWVEPTCGGCKDNRKTCFLKDNSTQLHLQCYVPNTDDARRRKVVTIGAVVGSATLLAVLVGAFRAYNSDRNAREIQFKMETFLNDYKAQKPSRYSYNDIKLITKKFKEKIGEGAYGTVFKGKLSDSFFVAVKVLNSSKGDGEEFINEVGTIGQIHHVNVVRLVGYCADGSRRALVYDFLSNGSLQHFISSPDSERFLGWKKLQDISLGIAKGVEYLHQGCDQRILHFDIKPHNVLLDQNFTPKISDFGLAKLCSKDQSLVSMSTARGTMGYIAPEVFSRNFGNVSYKSDVYSFGMVLLEMVGGRRTSNENDKTQIYYPEWIYNLLDGDDFRIGIGEEVHCAIAKRLAIVGLWCIQWDPANRPSMKTVVHMLQGGDALLSTPPNPFIAAGSTKNTVDNKPKRRIMNLELEAIAELE